MVRDKVVKNIKFIEKITNKKRVLKMSTKVEMFTEDAVSQRQFSTHRIKLYARHEV